jgi:beta-glucosidase
MVGQIPVHYNQKNTGKPPTPSTTVHIDDIDAQAPQTSIGMTAFHLDAGYRPLFEFGFGLSYARFEYANITTADAEIRCGDTLEVSAQLTNHGDVAAEEVAQLYVRDRVGSVTRPVRELKGFRRVRVAPGQTLTVAFELHTDALAFHGRDMSKRAEAGLFDVWIGGSSQASLHTQFRLLEG